MKTVQFIVGMVLSSSFLFHSQAQQVTFSGVYYDSKNRGIQVNSVCASYNNGYMIAGEASMGGLIIQVGSTGYIVWNKTFNRDTSYNSNVVFNSIITTKDSCFVLVGSVSNPISDEYEALCVKIESNGDIIWAKTINQPGYSIYATFVQQTYDSGYVMTGFTDDQSKVFTAKVDFTGTLQWTNILNSSYPNSAGNSVRQTPDSGYVITGYMEKYSTYDGNAILIKLSPTGTFLWSNKYYLSSKYECRGNDLEITNDGFLIYLNISGHIGIVETDSLGNINWIKSYNENIGSGSGGINVLYSTSKLHMTPDSGYIFVHGGGIFNGGITKIDPTGNIVWSRNLVLPAVDVIPSNNNEYFIVGNGPVVGVKTGLYESLHIGVIQIDSLGYAEDCVSESSVDTIVDSILTSSITFTSLTGGTSNTINTYVDSISIGLWGGCVSYIGAIDENNLTNGIQIFPNPSNGTFNIITGCTRKTEISVFNILGEKIYHSKHFYPEFEIDLSAQPKGIYFYKVMFSAKDMVTGKLVITH